MRFLKFPHFLSEAVLAIIFGMMICLSVQANPAAPLAEKGVLDLRNWDFEKDGTLDLAGEWEFYWKTFLDPHGPREDQSPSHYMPVPGVWLDHKVEGEPLDVYGHATYRLKILLPEGENDLAFYLKRVQSSYQMYVNGRLWMQAGKPGETAAQEDTFIAREVGWLKAASGTLDIVIHVSNFAGYTGGGFFSTFSLGPALEQHHLHMKEIAQDVFLGGALLCLGLFLMILHSGRIRERTYFILYTMSFMAAVYMVTVTSTLVELMPSFPWIVSERISYMCAAFLVALTYEFLHQVNPRPFNHVLSTFFLYQAAAFSVFVILWPGGLPREIFYILGWQLFGVIIGSLLELRYIVKNRIMGAGLILLGIATLVIVGVHDLLHTIGLLGVIYIGPYGILVMLLSFAAILALKVNAGITRNEQMAEAISALKDCVAIFDRSDRIVVWNSAYKSHLSNDAQKLLKLDVKYMDLLRLMLFPAKFWMLLAVKRNI